ncbi:MAG: hypothetical protein F6K58_10730 [Symploca sp. SIO2E9]|nr:hypothetical protein [Symploca sp. SIO2E9]
MSINYLPCPELRLFLAKTQLPILYFNKITESAEDDALEMIASFAVEN